MCGIYGFIGKPKKGKEKKLYELMKALGKHTEVRGKDATGFYAITPEFEYVEKNCVPATEFYNNAAHAWEAINGGAYVFLGHNRWASIGAIDNDNAHPFLGEKYALIMNGTYNKIFDIMSDAAFDKLEGETDSEAILHELDIVGMDAKFLKKLNNYAIVTFDREEHTVFFFRDPNRPMVVYDFRKTLGVRIFASTDEIAEKAFRAVRISFKNTKVFATHPYCVYEVNPDDGEVHRLFQYRKMPAATKTKKAVAKGEGEAKETRPTYYKKFYDKHYLTDFVPDHIRKALAVFGD